MIAFLNLCRRVATSRYFNSSPTGQWSLPSMSGRMKAHLSAMEFFGSRADEPVPVCEAEITSCDYLVGIYAWRYGWRPKGGPSITEQEFTLARERGRKCLCYVVDEAHPWPPKHIDSGEPAQLLAGLKLKVSKLVRSVFTTPDTLAKQVAADLARELVPERPPDTFGGLVRINWDIFAPEVKHVLTTAYGCRRAQAQDTLPASRGSATYGVFDGPARVYPEWHATCSAGCRRLRA